MKNVGSQIHRCRAIEADDFFEFNIFDRVVGFKCQLADNHSDDGGIDTDSEVSSSPSASSSSDGE